MIIIVDSGSTKSDWAIVHDDGVLVRQTMVGMNPTTNTNLAAITLPETLAFALANARVIFFYAAGIGTVEADGKLLQWLYNYGFRGKAELRSDIYAAIAATCGVEPGIVGILGTGSNSCSYDGAKIIDAIPSLGYILSDEGGGVDIGKMVLSQYFYRQMPNHISAKFKIEYPTNRTEVLQNIYQSSSASKYLASFSKFLIELDDPWKDELILAVFDKFIKIRILCYKESSQLPIHFVGSIAYHYKDYLAQSLTKHSLQLGKIIKSPIENLINFHSQNHKQ